MLAVAMFLTCATSLTADDGAGDVDMRPRALVLDFQGDAVGVETRKSIAGLVVVKLAKDPRVDVISGQDIKGMAALAADKQAAGCDDACLAEIAGAMDARLVVSGFVGRLGSLYVVNMSLFDAQKARAVGRCTVEAESIEQLPSKLDGPLRELLRELPPPAPRKKRARIDDAPARGPAPLAIGLLAGGAGVALVGVALAGGGAFYANEAQRARSELDNAAGEFESERDVDELREAHDTYVSARDAYNNAGPALLWGAGALVVLGIATASASAAFWSGE